MRVTYHVARYQAGLVRAAFAASLDRRRPVGARGRLPWEVVSFSCARDLPEEVASLRSLIAAVGLPASVTVVSDGSHTAEDASRLRRSVPTARVVDWRHYAAPQLVEHVRPYADVQPMGKKLAALASLPRAPVLYADSDVLFFAGAAAADVFASNGASWYLPDEEGGLDPRLLMDGEDAPPANAGLFFAHDGLTEIGPLLKRLSQRPERVGLYAEQTLVHLALHAAGARPLPARSFLLTYVDQFSYRDRADPRTACARHYVSSTRHKFWLAVSRTSLIGR